MQKRGLQGCWVPASGSSSRAEDGAGYSDSLSLGYFLHYPQLSRPEHPLISNPATSSAHHQASAKCDSGLGQQYMRQEGGRETEGAPFQRRPTAHGLHAAQEEPLTFPPRPVGLFWALPCHAAADSTPWQTPRPRATTTPTCQLSLCSASLLGRATTRTHPCRCGTGVLCLAAGCVYVSTLAGGAKRFSRALTSSLCCAAGCGRRPHAGPGSRRCGASPSVACT